MGQRRSEVLGMSFEELDMTSATWTIPKERSKNGKAHIVPLSAPAVTELTALGAGERRRGLVFMTTGTTTISGISRLKSALDKAMLQELRQADEVASLVSWRLHDIRRTVATGLQRLGVRYEVTEAVLNHVSGAKSGVAGVYQRHDWKDEKRAALEAWGRHVEVMSSDPKQVMTNISSLRAGA
jgi:integrase